MSGGRGTGRRALAALLVGVGVHGCFDGMPPECLNDGECAAGQACVGARCVAAAGGGDAAGPGEPVGDPDVTAPGDANEAGSGPPLARDAGPGQFDAADAGRTMADAGLPDDGDPRDAARVGDDARPADAGAPVDADAWLDCPRAAEQRDGDRVFLAWRGGILAYERRALFERPRRPPPVVDFRLEGESSHVLEAARILSEGRLAVGVVGPREPGGERALWLIDLVAGRPLDADPARPGTQGVPVAHGPANEGRDRIRLAPMGATRFAASYPGNFDHRVAVFDLAAGVRLDQDPAVPGVQNHRLPASVAALTATVDGQLYAGSAADAVIHALRPGEAPVALALPEALARAPVDGLAPSGPGRLWVAAGSFVALLDVSAPDAAPRALRIVALAAPRLRHARVAALEPAADGSGDAFAVVQLSDVEGRPAGAELVRLGPDRPVPRWRAELAEPDDDAAAPPAWRLAVSDVVLTADVAAVPPVIRAHDPAHGEPRGSVRLRDDPAPLDLLAPEAVFPDPCAG